MPDTPNSDKESVFAFAESALSGPMCASRNAVPLSAKVTLARDIMTAAVARYGVRNIAVAWTGGKDSTVTLHLWRSVLAEMGESSAVRVINLDTGVKFPEIVAFRDTLALRWGLDMQVARPAVSLAGYPVAVDPVACCAELKVEPLNRAVKEHGVRVLLTGIRRDEHPDRNRPVCERRERPDCLMLHSVLPFTEMDIWAYTVENDVPWCSLYGEGYRSLGCMPCTQKGEGAEERAGRAASKEANMETLRGLGYF